MAYKRWCEKSRTSAVGNPSTIKQLVVDERFKKFSLIKDVLPGAILCRFVALPGSVDDQLEEVWVFRHPEHGVGQVSVAKTVAHKTLLEDWRKLLHTRDRDFNRSHKNSIKILWNISVKCLKCFLEVIPSRVCIKVYSSELVNYLQMDSNNR